MSNVLVMFAPIGSPTFWLILIGGVIVAMFLTSKPLKRIGKLLGVKQSG